MNSLLPVMFVGCLALLFTVQGVEGIQCYSCAVTNCADDELDTSTVAVDECRTNVCMKKKVGDSIGRGCAREAPSNTDECIDEGDTVSCYCSTKLCNTGTRGTTYSLAMVVLSIAVTLFTLM